MPLDSRRAVADDGTDTDIKIDVRGGRVVGNRFEDFCQGAGLGELAVNQATHHNVGVLEKGPRLDCPGLKRPLFGVLQSGGSTEGAALRREEVLGSFTALPVARPNLARCETNPFKDTVVEDCLSICCGQVVAGRCWMVSFVIQF